MPNRRIVEVRGVPFVVEYMYDEGTATWVVFPDNDEPFEAVCLVADGSSFKVSGDGDPV